MSTWPGGNLDPLGASRDLKDFALRCVIAAAIVLAAAVLWHAAGVFVLVFGGVVVAVALRSLTRVVTRYTPLGEPWALFLVTVLLAGFLLGLGALIGSRLADQLGELVHTVETAWSQLHVELQKSALGRTLLNAESKTAAATSATHLVVAASTSVAAVTDVIVILLVGLFLAAEPGLYRRGLLMVAPRAARAGTQRLLNGFGVALTHWLQGTLVAMLAVGAMTTLGLWLLGVPLALSLGILAGVAEFVPYVGPIVSAVPAILVAFTLSPTQALEVGGLYLAIHSIEAYLLVPIIQKRAVALPPALGIVAVVFFGLMLGLVGVIFAHPLVVCLLVVVKQLCGEPKSLS
jgi:predicted PurR-regulated permease PerM